MTSDALVQCVGEPITSSLPTFESKTSEERLSECLKYEAPWLTQRLCQYGVASSEAEAAALFVELKRYLLLAQQQGERVVPMFSLRLDEVWHQFILFTADYAAFCVRYFGHYLHHVPEQAEPRQPLSSGERFVHPLSLSQFEALYTSAFGALPELWSDAAAVSVTSRVVHAVEGLYCRQRCEFVELVRASDDQVVCRAGRRAKSAMGFIARHSRFLVRELPDLNGDTERVKLVRPLVQYGALRLNY
jgi:hypothetical protein